MKIDKILKVVSIIIGFVGVILGLYTFSMDLRWMLTSKNFELILKYVFIISGSIITALIIYGFGEMLELLYKINENLSKQIEK
ncbi:MULTISPECIES: hypothetical protein [unclassified Romboutsia]|uniref:hypothetical protein n=1 Tax=unclassified Romboutsia TaxID=2626894 RepID=UPI000F057F31|nr:MULTISPECIES: hypothetical protein [unclassified Romboutsia]